jgi:hypothetical protein
MEGLRTSRIYHRQWCVAACSARTCEGLDDGLEWLVGELTQ